MENGGSKGLSKDTLDRLAKEWDAQIESGEHEPGSGVSAVVTSRGDATVFTRIRKDGTCTATGRLADGTEVIRED